MNIYCINFMVLMSFYYYYINYIEVQLIFLPQRRVNEVVVRVLVLLRTVISVQDAESQDILSAVALPTMTLLMTRIEHSQQSYMLYRQEAVRK